jgi:hypothetical protein
LLKNLRGTITSELAGLDAVFSLYTLSTSNALYSRNSWERPAINIWHRGKEAKPYYPAVAGSTHLYWLCSSEEVLH